MKIGSFEVIYRDGQAPVLRQGFDVFDASGVNRSTYRELYAFNEFARQEVWRNYDFSGLFSPRFFAKTGIDAERYFRFVTDNPGFDVYLFHPYPRELSIASHFLELAELEHFGITQALEEVWSHIFGLPLPVLDAQADRTLCCHCNYFLGSPTFWSEYAFFVREFVQYLESRSGSKLRDETPYTLTRSDDKALPLGVFAFERALSLFLKQQGLRLKAINHAYSDASWSAPEVFAGESDLVSELLARINAADIDSRNKARSLAVRAYYFFRRLAVQKYE